MGIPASNIREATLWEHSDCEPQDCEWRALAEVEEMSLNEYQRQSMRTADFVDPQDPQAWCYQLSGFGLGIAGEAGEVADILKKTLHHGHQMDREVMKKELGDVLWYLQAIADRYGLTLEEVAKANVHKLMERYPEGFSSERSINRAQEDK